MVGLCRVQITRTFFPDVAEANDGSYGSLTPEAASQATSALSNSFLCLVSQTSKPWKEFFRISPAANLNLAGSLGRTRAASTARLGLSKG